MRQRLGLRSDWFPLPSTSARQAQALVRGLWADLPGRAPGPGQLAARSRELVGGRLTAALALDLVPSGERLGLLVGAAHAGAGTRRPCANVAGSQEALRRRLDALYALLLQRAPDPGAAASSLSCGGAARSPSRSGSPPCRRTRCACSSAPTPEPAPPRLPTSMPRSCAPERSPHPR